MRKTAFEQAHELLKKTSKEGFTAWDKYEEGLTMTNIPQDILDDAKEAGFGQHRDGELIFCGYYISDEIKKLCQLRDERQRSSGEPYCYMDSKGNVPSFVTLEMVESGKVFPVFTTPQQQHIPEEVTAKIKGLPRFSFLSPKEGGVKRWGNASGAWIEQYEVIKILDDYEYSATPSAPDATQSQAVRHILRYLTEWQEYLLETKSPTVFEQSMLEELHFRITTIKSATQAKDGE